MLAYIQYPSWIHPEIVPWLPIRWYGLMYLVAFVITYLLFMWQLRQRHEKPQSDLVLDMFFWAIIGLLIGARAFAVTIYDATGYYLRHPLQIILPFAMVDGRLRLTGIARDVVSWRPPGSGHRPCHLHAGEEAEHPRLGGHAGCGHPAGIHVRPGTSSTASSMEGSRQPRGAWCSPARKAFPSTSPGSVISRRGSGCRFPGRDW